MSKFKDTLTFISSLSKILVEDENPRGKFLQVPNRAVTPLVMNIADIRKVHVANEMRVIKTSEAIILIAFDSENKLDRFYLDRLTVTENDNTSNVIIILSPSIHIIDDMSLKDLIQELNYIVYNLLDEQKIDPVWDTLNKFIYVWARSYFVYLCIYMTYSINTKMIQDIVESIQPISDIVNIADIQSTITSNSYDEDYRLMVSELFDKCEVLSYMNNDILNIIRSEENPNI